LSSSTLTLQGGPDRRETAGLSDPKLKAQLTDLSATVLPGTPADFGKFIADETEKWRKLIQAAGIKST
jgi:tripartite-type tricarboxylate transporter receptor subunit TctC